MRGRGDGNKILHGNELILGRTCSMIRRTKLLTSQYLLPLKTDHLELSLLLIIWIAHRTIMIHSVNDIILVSMVMDTGGPTVWFDRQRNKYNLGIQFMTILVNVWSFNISDSKVVRLETKLQEIKSKEAHQILSTNFTHRDFE